MSGLPLLTMLDGVSAIVAGEAFTFESEKKTFQVIGETSSGSGSATIDLEVSNVPSPISDEDWVLLKRFSLTLGTTQTGDSCVSDTPWRHTRANLTAISGTGATVSGYVCIAD